MPLLEKAQIESDDKSQLIPNSCFSTCGMHFSVFMAANAGTISRPGGGQVRPPDHHLATAV